MEKTIEIKQSNVDAAYKVADEYMKKVLDALLGRNTAKPSLDDYKSIKSYADACIALDEEPIDEEKLLNAGCEARHIALMKLETISRALWGRNFKPVPDPEGRKWFYYPWFALYTQREMDDMSDEDKGGLLCAHAHYGASAGFGCLDTNYRSSLSSANSGFRLCQEDEEKAKYFGKQFIELWAEWLLLDWKIKTE